MLRDDHPFTLPATARYPISVALMLMFFWTARWVAVYRDLPARSCFVSEPEARGPEDHERHGVARSQQ
jgi:hypothetical protein